MLRRLVLVSLMSLLASCYYVKDFSDVSYKSDYSFLLGKDFETNSRMLIQSFDELTSIDDVVNGEDVEYARLLHLPGLRNRHLNWTIEIPPYQKFKVVKIIEAELAGGKSIYFLVEFEGIKELEDVVTIVRVSNTAEIDMNSWLSSYDFERVEGLMLENWVG